MAKFKMKTPIAKIKRDIIKGVQRKLPSVLESAITSDIEKGVSPVKGQRFVKYSKSYKYQIKNGYKNLSSKSKSLVNLKVTGEMLKSLVIKRHAKGIKIVFNDKKSSYHNDGTDKIPRRAMLPTKEGEEFNKRINDRVATLIERIAAVIFNKK